MRDFKRDAVWAALAMGAGFALAVLLNYGTPFGLGFLAGRFSKHDAKVETLRDTIRIADSVVITRTDTVIKYHTIAVKAKAASDSAKVLSDSLDRLVAILNDSTVHVIGNPSDSAVAIPYVVVADIQALRRTVAKQDTTIHWLTVENRSLWMRDTTRQWQIESRDKLIRELSKPKCGRKCGLVIGLTAGLIVHKAAK